MNRRELNFPLQAWTDYPLKFGEAGQMAPIREVTVLGYDGDKYCRIRFGGEEYEVKRFYLYAKPGRFDEVPAIADERKGG